MIFDPPSIYIIYTYIYISTERKRVDSQLGLDPIATRDDAAAHAALFYFYRPRRHTSWHTRSPLRTEGIFRAGYDFFVPVRIRTIGQRGNELRSERTNPSVSFLFFRARQLRSSALIPIKWVNTGSRVKFLGFIVSFDYPDTGFRFPLRGNGLISFGELGKVKEGRSFVFQWHGWLIEVSSTYVENHSSATPDFEF